MEGTGAPPRRRTSHFFTFLVFLQNFLALLAPLVFLLHQSSPFLSSHGGGGGGEFEFGSSSAQHSSSHCDQRGRAGGGVGGLEVGASGARLSTRILKRSHQVTRAGAGCRVHVGRGVRARTG